MSGAEAEPDTKIKRFRFKHSSRRSHDGHRRHRHSKRRRQEEDAPPTGDQDLPPETAFRESLFDALADDEGAAFWEGVYGQPIHTYAAQKGGEMERMTDDEYVAYVRARMWEKSHGHIIEERRKRETARQRKEQEKRQKQHEQDAWQQQIEEALQRGQERRNKGRKGAAWQRYRDFWEQAECCNIAELVWPVESGSSHDVCEDTVRAFYSHLDDDRLEGVLKKDRVRWHPDKIQQRARGDIAPGVMELVTLVFQVVDALWSERTAPCNRNT